MTFLLFCCRRGSCSHNALTSHTGMERKQARKLAESYMSVSCDRAPSSVGRLHGTQSPEAHAILKLLGNLPVSLLTLAFLNATHSDTPRRAPNRTGSRPRLTASAAP